MALVERAPHPLLSLMVEHLKVMAALTVEPAYASLTVEPCFASSLLGPLPPPESCSSPPTLPHPTRLTSSLYHPSYHSSPVEPTLPTPAFLDAYWVVGLIIIYVITL
jgi:hypothetical protein